MADLEPWVRRELEAAREARGLPPYARKEKGGKPAPDRQRSTYVTVELRETKCAVCKAPMRTSLPRGKKATCRPCVVAAAAERQAAVLELRAAGESFVEIGKKLLISAKRARRIYHESKR